MALRAQKTLLFIAMSCIDFHFWLSLLIFNFAFDLDFSLHRFYLSCKPTCNDEVNQGAGPQVPGCLWRADQVWFLCSIEAVPVIEVQQVVDVPTLWSMSKKIAKEEDHRNNIEICRNVNLPKSVAVEMQVWCSLLSSLADNLLPNASTKLTALPVNRFDVKSDRMQDQISSQIPIHLHPPVTTKVLCVRIEFWFSVEEICCRRGGEGDKVNEVTRWTPTWCRAPPSSPPPPQPCPHA